MRVWAEEREATNVSGVTPSGVRLAGARARRFGLEWFGQGSGRGLEDSETWKMGGIVRH